VVMSTQNARSEVCLESKVRPIEGLVMEVTGDGEFLFLPDAGLAVEAPPYVLLVPSEPLASEDRLRLAIGGRRITCPCHNVHSIVSLDGETTGILPKAFACFVDVGAIGGDSADTKLSLGELLKRISE
jgi:hypothetical protein